MASGFLCAVVQYGTFTSSILKQHISTPYCYHNTRWTQAIILLTAQRDCCHFNEKKKQREENKNTGLRTGIESVPAAAKAG